MNEWLSFGLLAVTGFVAGVLNVVAGGGSFLTLPVLILLGLPAAVANGTNRVGLLLQNVGGVVAFHRHRVLDWRWALRASLPALAGAALGTWMALVVGDVAFRRILASVMVLMTLWPLIGSSPAMRQTPAKSGSVVMVIGFFLIGIYAGFLQAGVGFLILAITSMAGFDLVRGNAIKVFSILLLTVLSLAIFASQQSVDWPLGLALGLGTFVGGQAGVRLTVLKGHRWIQTVVSVAIVVFAITLWLF